MKYNVYYSRNKKIFMNVATGPWGLTQKGNKKMFELDLQDLLANELRKIFKDYSLPTKNGTLQEIKIFTQFLPQPSGLTVREKNSEHSIVPQGYSTDDLESNFPCIVIKLEGSNDKIQNSLRQSQINIGLIIGTYDKNEDCQGYRDVINIMHKIRLHLLTLPGYVLCERFRLNNELLTMQLLNDSEWPYFFGTIETTWDAAQPLNINYF